MKNVYINFFETSFCKNNFFFIDNFNPFCPKNINDGYLNKNNTKSIRCKLVIKGLLKLYNFETYKGDFKKSCKDENLQNLIYKTIINKNEYLNSENIFSQELFKEKYNKISKALNLNNNCELQKFNESIIKEIKTKKIETDKRITEYIVNFFKDKYEEYNKKKNFELDEGVVNSIIILLYKIVDKNFILPDKLIKYICLLKKNNKGFYKKFTEKLFNINTNKSNEVKLLKELFSYLFKYIYVENSIYINCIGKINEKSFLKNNNKISYLKLYKEYLYDEKVLKSYQNDLKSYEKDLFFYLLYLQKLLNDNGELEKQIIMVHKPPTDTDKIRLKYFTNLNNYKGKENNIKKFFYNKNLRNYILNHTHYHKKINLHHFFEIQGILFYYFKYHLPSEELISKNDEIKNLRNFIYDNDLNNEVNLIEYIKEMELNVKININLDLKSTNLYMVEFINNNYEGLSFYDNEYGKEYNYDLLTGFNKRLQKDMEGIFSAFSTATMDESCEITKSNKNMFKPKKELTISNYKKENFLLSNIFYDYDSLNKFKKNIKKKLLNNSNESIIYNNNKNNIFYIDSNKKKIKIEKKKEKTLKSFQKLINKFYDFLRNKLFDALEILNMPIDSKNNIKIEEKSYIKIEEKSYIKIEEKSLIALFSILQNFFSSDKGNLDKMISKNNIFSNIDEKLKNFLINKENIKKNIIYNIEDSQIKKSTPSYRCISDDLKKINSTKKYTLNESSYKSVICPTIGGNLKSKRKCPKKHAKEFKLGTKKKGIDGKLWVVSKRKDNVKVWKRV